MSLVKTFNQSKALKAVKGLAKQELADARKIDVLPVCINLLSSKDYFELSVVLNTQSLNKSLPVVGFYFQGTTKTYQRCFKTKFNNLNDAVEVLKNSIEIKHKDPFDSPFLLVDDNNSDKAYWPVVIKKENDEIDTIGYIPMRKTSIFHTCKSHPIIYLEGAKTNLHLAIDVDRNQLLPSKPLLDAQLTETLNVASKLAEQNATNWGLLALPSHVSAAPSSVDEANQTLDYITDELKKRRKTNNNIDVITQLVLKNEEQSVRTALTTVCRGASGKARLVDVTLCFAVAEHAPQVFHSLLSGVKRVRHCARAGVSVYSAFLANESASKTALYVRGTDDTPPSQAVVAPLFDERRLVHAVAQCLRDFDSQQAK